MKIQPLNLAGAFTIELAPIADDRGSFRRVFCQREFRQIRPDIEFVQINMSENKSRGTVRGLHYQRAPSAEAKLVSCISGRVLDVIVDIRRGSPTFLKHVTIELSPENNRLVFIPEGFAHGFQTLCDDSRLMYFHTQFYDPEREAGIHYADPAVSIAWPLDDVVVSDKDQARPPLSSDFDGIDVR